MLSSRVVNEGCPLPALLPLRKIFHANVPAYLESQLAKSFSSNTYEMPVNVDSKRLTQNLSPLEATLTKNRGEGVSQHASPHPAILSALFIFIFSVFPCS